MEGWRAAHWRRDLVVSPRYLASRTMVGAGWAEAVLDVRNCDGAPSPTCSLASDVEWHSTWGGGRGLDRWWSDQREPHGAVAGPCAAELHSIRSRTLSLYSHVSMWGSLYSWPRAVWRIVMRQPLLRLTACITYTGANTTETKRVTDLHVAWNRAERDVVRACVVRACVYGACTIC